MPLYEYECPICEKKFEFLVALESRDKVRFTCDACGTRLFRSVTIANFGKPPHRTQAILSNGEKVSGIWEK